jgi:hypothetical protein
MAHNLTESSTFTVTVQVPDDGDFVNEAALEPGMQALANRTKYLNDRHVARPGSSTDEAFARWDGTTGELLMNGVVKATDAGAVTGVTSLVMSAALSGATTIDATGDITAGDDVRATGDFEYVTPPVRTGFIPLSAGASGAGWTLGSASSGLWTASQDSVTLQFPLILPVGAIVTRLRIGVDPGAARAGNNRMGLELWRLTPNTTTGARSVTQVGTTARDDTTTNNQVVTLDLSGTPYTVLTTECIHVGVVAGNTASSSNDVLYWVEVQYTDPGPRSPFA